MPHPDTEPGAQRSRDERRICAAQDVLRTTIRDLYLSHHGAPGPAGKVRVQLSVTVSPDDLWRLEFDPPLPEQVLPQLADREAARESIRPGHVYCFRCLSAECGHSSPPGPLHVFRGYDAAGRPEWQEFIQTLLDERDERVGQLYEKPPRLISRFQYGRALKGQQLAAFGKSSLSYSILSQVVAGYFHRDGERLGLSLQWVEGRDRQGEVLLRLNPIGYGLNGSFLLAWLSSEQSAVLFRAIQVAERELSGLEAAVRAAKAASDRERVNSLMGRIPVMARRLSAALERGDRQGSRRTKHVETRRQEMRPVHKARDDAGSARREQCFRDEKAGTWMIVGERGRTHAFNDGGKHVTSFMMKPSSVAFRVRSDRWRPATDDDWTILKNLLQTNAGEQIDDQPTNP